MARKMDKFRNEHQSIRSIDEKIAKQNKILKDLKAQRETHSSVIMKAMQNSTEGTIDGQVVFKKKISERSTATIGRVREFAPELADKIIQTTKSEKIEVL